jgi:SAM-dependent methyltransferase
MERRDPARFPLDDKRVYDAYVAGRQSAALAVAVRIGLFERLNERPGTERELLDHFGYAARPFRALLSALLAIGLLEREGGRFTLAPDAARYLVKGEPGWLGGLVDLEIDHFLSPRAFLDALEGGDPSVYGGSDPWAEHEADPEKARRFTEAMHSVSERPAAGLAEAVDFSGVARLLDVGGGSGALSIAFARAWDVGCVVWDLPVVCALAREYAERAGVADRVTAEAGDMFAQPFPRGHDAILFSQILHDWPPEKDAALLSKAHDALEPGGLILVHEKLVEDGEERPLANALVNLDMAVWTEGQQFRERELRALLEDAGFRRIERRPTAGYWSVMVGIR